MRQFILGCLFSCTSTLAFGGEKTGRLAPDFGGAVLDGEQLKLSDYRGKVVLIDVWASWCVPCRKEMPFLTQLRHQFRDEAFEIVAVNIDDNLKNVRAFLKKLMHQPQFPIMLDPKKNVPKLYKIKAMPTTILVDKTGKIRFWHDGFKESQKQKYIDEIQLLLSEKME